MNNIYTEDVREAHLQETGMVPVNLGEYSFHRDNFERLELKVTGDSMSPTFEIGDIVLADILQQGTAISDGIYVIRIDGALLIRRIQRLPGYKINIICDNPLYAPVYINLNEVGDRIEVFAKLKWHFRRL